MLRTTHSSSDRMCLLILWFLSSSWITDIHKHSLVCLCSVGKLTALSQHGRPSLSDSITEKGFGIFYHSVILHVLPKPHCRTCSFVIFRFLPPPLFPTSARSEHRSRIITPQRNLSAGCHLIFFPPQMQSVIRNPSCHGDAIFGAECLLPHFF